MERMGLPSAALQLSFLLSLSVGITKLNERGSQGDPVVHRSTRGPGLGALLWGFPTEAQMCPCGFWCFSFWVCFYLGFFWCFFSCCSPGKCNSLVLFQSLYGSLEIESKNNMCTRWRKKARLPPVEQMEQPGALGEVLVLPAASRPFGSEGCGASQPPRPPSSLLGVEE